MDFINSIPTHMVSDSPILVSIWSYRNLPFKLATGFRRPRIFGNFVSSHSDFVRRRRAVVGLRHPAVLPDRYHLGRRPRRRHIGKQSRKCCFERSKINFGISNFSWQFLHGRCSGGRRSNGKKLVQTPTLLTPSQKRKSDSWLTSCLSQSFIPWKI